MSDDPLLQPYRLKHLTLRNRIMITSHEPAYPEDGMPKDRYRAYHVERAKAGVALTMTAGSAAVSRDSPPVFNNILAWKDEVVGWMRKLTDECHEHGTAVMIQLTHLGRRTRWDKADWLPVVSPSHEREAAHRAFPKKMEDWDIQRIITDYADAAERMKAAGMDGMELQAYGHLMDQFWSPLTNDLEGPYGGSLDNRLRFTFDVLRGIRERCGPDFLVGLRYTGDECLPGGFGADDGITISQKLKDSGQVDFLNVVRGRIDTDAGHDRRDPGAGHAQRAASGICGTDPEGHRIADLPCRQDPRRGHGPPCHRGGAGRHGGHDAGAYGRPASGPQDRGRARGRHPPLRRRELLPGSHLSGRAGLLPAQRRHRARGDDAPRHSGASETRRVTIVGAGPGGLEAARVAAERGHAVTVFEAADQPGGQIRLTARQERRREMISIVAGGWRCARSAG